MSGARYTDEFKVAPVKQVIDRCHPAAEVAERLGVGIHSIYVWIKRYGVPDAECKANDTQAEEKRRLGGELNHRRAAADRCAVRHRREHTR